MQKYTPMMEQYLSIKAQVQDAFLFFRLGDFYEMFFEDALLASKELEITLTGREAGSDERVPMCGVPYHSAENYIARLIDKGYKVAICEQVENPNESKGIVRREIVRIVTPGTVMEGKSLTENINNYLAAITVSEGRFGFAVCDMTTGEFHTTSFDSLYDVADELHVFSVSEVVAEENELEQLKVVIWGRTRKLMFTTHEKPLLVGEWMSSHFPTLTLDGLLCEQQSASALLLSYVLKTQKRSLGHIRTVQRYETQAYMMLDSFSRKNLELTESARDHSRRGSLLGMLDRTVTAMGGRRIRSWLDKPLTSQFLIRKRLDAVEVLYNNLIFREDIRELLKQVYDLERLSGRIAYGSANARDLIALAQSLFIVPKLMELCNQASQEDTILQEIAAGPDVCTDIYQWIIEAIQTHPPISTREGGMIADGYDAQLDRLREASRGGKQWIAELEQAEREATGIRSLKAGFNKVFGYYIEVTKANLHMVPEGRYERKQTLAAAERYITPELKAKEALILEAEEKTVDLEHSLFHELRERISVEISRLQRLSDRLAILDALQSLATTAFQNRYVRPEVHVGFDFEIIEGRHPVVESVVTSNTFISNDTQLTAEHTRALLITGPNMAGKSTYMRQVALISIMAQIGSFVPAKRARVPVIDKLFTRIGAADDLAGGQSTFMVEMSEIQTMLVKATNRSLVIIDELGRGTSTSEGMAIAQAVIEYIYEYIGCKTLISTHYHELALLETSLPYLVNVSMAVKESGTQVTFLRKLVKGAADSSYGIYCAQLAGLPSAVIERAYSLLHNREPSALSIQPIIPLIKQTMELHPRVEQWIDRLESVDLDQLTPLQALNLLQEMKTNIQKMLPHHHK